MSPEFRTFGNSSLYPGHKLPDEFELRKVAVDLSSITAIGENGHYETAKAIFDHAAEILGSDYALKGMDYCLCVDGGPVYGPCAAYQLVGEGCEIVVALPAWADKRPKTAAGIYTYGDPSSDIVIRVSDAVLNAHLFLSVAEARHPRPAC